MFTYNAFLPTQPLPNASQSQPQQLPNLSPVRSNSRPLQNNSPAYQPAWGNFTPTLPQANVNPFDPFGSNQKKKEQAPQETKESEELDLSIKLVLDNEEKELSSTSSDSDEETDLMPEVFPNQWTTGMANNLRRNSEPFPSGTISPQKMIPNPQVNNTVSPKTWGALPTEKVTIKPSNFAPLSSLEFSSTDKRAYFVTLQGFNVQNGRRIFRLDRLCSALPARTQDETSFLYVDLWNDANLRAQQGLDNLFEPSSYSIPNTHFRLALTVNMSHAYEDPYHIEFNIDLRQHAFALRDRKPQGLEIVYADQPNRGSQEARISSGNSITIHAHLSGESTQQTPPQNVFNLFPKTPSPIKNSQPQDLTEFSVCLRQFFIRLPLRRTQPEPVHIPFVASQEAPKSQLYGKRGSAINLGQGHSSPGPVRVGTSFQSGTISPISWANFSTENSPTYKPTKQAGFNSQNEPELPPGIIQNNNGPTDQQQMPGGSLFKFRNQGQQRNSVQLIKRDSDEGPNSKKRTNRILSTDFSQLVTGDCSPMKVLETLANATKNVNRRSSQTSEGSLRFIMENDYTSHSTSTLNASSFGDIVHEEDDESQTRTGSDVPDEFRLEDYIGKIAEFAKTSQGVKSLKKCVLNEEKESIDTIIQEISDRVGELLLDTHANHLVQALFQKGSAQQRLWLLQKLAPSFVNIARDKKGTHSLQSIVAHFGSAEEFVTVQNILGQYVIDLSMDSRANYVIQKLINVIPVESSHFLYQPLFDNFVSIANNSFGLLVLKQMMARVGPNQHLRQRVVEFTCLNFEKLIQNPYGNYAIQYVIEFYPKDSHMIMSKVLLKIIPYSSQKISSNVIEKVLIVCDAQFRRRILDEVLKNGKLGDLMKNKYGNFVTLQLLATSNHRDQQRLMQEIGRCVNTFNATKYKARWTKFIQEDPMKIGVCEAGQEERLDSPVKEEEINTENLESVKRIWREMTKEEKSEQPKQNTFQYGKKNNGKRQSFC